MRLIELILTGYKGFNLSNIGRFRWTPESNEQVILGSNGAGKSSLLHVIMSLVPNGNRFHPGGGQEYRFEHQGHMFHLHSVYKNKAGHHQFFMDGEQLNDGNTQATQKELVEKYVGLTQEIADIITGRVRLSQMSPNKRREWMMRISGTDFDFAMGLFEQFRVKARDLQGTIGYLMETSHKMADEIRSMEEDYQNTDKEIQELKQLSIELNQLLNGRMSVRSSEGAVEQMMTAYRNIQQRSQTIVAETVIRDNSKYGGRTRDQVDATITRLRDGMLVTRGECDSHEKALEGIQSLIRHVGRESLDDPSLLTAKLAGIEEELAAIRASGDLYDCAGSSPEALLTIARGIEGQLAELCATIPSNAENIYTRGEYQGCKDRHLELAQWVIEQKNVISKMEATLEHATHTQDTDCPKCQHKFKPGWPEGLVEQTRATLQKRYDEIEKVQKEMDTIAIHIGDFEDYSRKLGELARIREGSKALSTFWNYVSTKGYVKNAPHMIPVALADDVRRLVDTEYAQRIEKEQTELQSRLELIKNSGDPKFLLTRADMLEGELHDKYEAINQTITTIAELSEEYSHLEKIDTLLGEMYTEINRFTDLRQQVEEALRDEHLDQVRGKVMTRLGILHTQTQRYRDLQSRYENARSDLIDVEAKFNSFKLIAKALSPTHGIVAEATKNFIRHFTGMVNEHIAMVWTYPMEIDAVLEAGATLTCKLPISINGEPNLEGDIADGSTGQVSMIDFTFKLVLMELMGMVDYPLLADEFGKDFDDEHRERLVSYIQALMEQGRFSQLFMVSHYSSVYGSFNNAEFVVLDDRNITRPSGANQNVEIA